MLQQTQVVTVIPYYNKWLRRFPSFGALARAPGNDVLHAWQGLGYYARARNLHAAARTIVDRHRGKFPRQINELRNLPGVGKYTANAVASFAFDQSVPIVEANTARVLSRLFDVRIPIDQANGRAALWKHAASLIPKASSRISNSALIDLGALICSPRPKCELCPVKRFCAAPDPEILPRKRPRPRLKNLVETHAFVIRQDKILLEQSRGRWRGMWILPPLNRRTAATFTRTRGNNYPNGLAKLDCFKQSSSSRHAAHTSVFPFTHHRVTLRVFRRPARMIDNDQQHWFPIRALDSIPLPSPHRRALAALLGIEH